MSSISLSRIPRRFQALFAIVLLLAVLWVAVGHKLVGSSSSESGSETIAARHPAPTRVHPATLRAHSAAGTRAGALRAPAAKAGPRRSSVSPAHASAQRAPSRPSVASPAHPAIAKTPTRTLPTARTRVSTAPARSHAPAATHSGVAALSPTKARSLAPTRSHVQSARPGAAPGRPALTLPSASRAVEEELGAGKTVLLLFWTPQAVTDQFVKGEVQAAARSLGSSVVVRYATAAQVAEYGTFTEHVLITETPTLLVIAPPKEIMALAGFTEAETIKRAIAQARSAASAKPTGR